METPCGSRSPDERDQTSAGISWGACCSVPPPCLSYRPSPLGRRGRGSPAATQGHVQGASGQQVLCSRVLRSASDLLIGSEVSLDMRHRPWVPSPDGPCRRPISQQPWSRAAEKPRSTGLSWSARHTEVAVPVLEGRAVWGREVRAGGFGPSPSDLSPQSELQPRGRPGSRAQSRREGSGGGCRPTGVSPPCVCAERGNRVRVLTAGLSQLLSGRHGSDA